jgi:membrane fusion protein (multidrug efflux system)
MQVKAESVLLTAELPGRVSASTVSEVRPQVSGIILERLFEEGSDVRAGDVLYRIDPSLYQAALNNAKGALAKAEANVSAARNLVQRYAHLTKVNAISKQEYDDARAAYGQTLAEVEEARALLETAQINLDYTQVRSPVSGRIGRSAVTPGALVTMNQAESLATVHNMETMYVDVTQSTRDLLRLKRAYENGTLRHSEAGALQATLKYDDGTLYTRRIHAKTNDPATPAPDAAANPSYEDIPVTGSLKFSEVTADQSTGMVTVRIVFPNPEQSLLSGMYVHAVIEEGVREQAVLVPQKAVARDNRGRHFVRLLTPAAEDGKDGTFIVAARAVTIDRPVGNNWLIADGPAPGELLLLEGAMRLRPNEPVFGVLENNIVQGESSRYTAAVTDSRAQ